MKTTKLLIILLSLFAHFNADAETVTKCVNVIFPHCPEGDGGTSPLISNNNLKNSSVCDTAIIQQPMFGMINYGADGNVFEIDSTGNEVDTLYLPYIYTTNTNCEVRDSFYVAEISLDNMNNCDTTYVWYILNIEFQCETPDDVICCIPDDGEPITFNVLENDMDFITANYPGFQQPQVFISGIVTQPAFGIAQISQNGAVIIYTPPVGFMGVDSVVYEVEYYLQNPTDTITICDEQTCYVIIEDCIQTLTDELTVTLGDTIYFNALANDYIAPDIENLTELGCPDTLPQIDPSSFSLLTSGAEINSLGNGDLCFTSPASGCFSYEYQVCSTAGVCATGTITVNVNNCIDVQIYAHLEGAYDSVLDTMSTALNDRGILPGQTSATSVGQPYNTAPWNYSGTEGAAWTDTDYTGDETDWVLVSFRTDTVKNTEVGMTAALLNKDGSITFPDCCALTSSVASPLYIVVEHRNHIGVMTPQPIDVINNTLTYDFRLSDSYDGNGTGSGQKQLPSGLWAMFVGDADQSDFPSYDILGSDKAIWSDNNGTFYNYTPSDMNLDGDVNGADKTLWFNNNGISSRVPK